jgi:hypothetical protein
MRALPRGTRGDASSELPSALQVAHRLAQAARVAGRELLGKRLCLV